MADNELEDFTQLTNDAGVTIPRMNMSEIGYSGLKVSSGIIYEEARRELRWPDSIRTYKEMRKDTTISAALKAYELMISRVKWDVEACKDATDQQKLRAEFIESVMHDMEGSWFQFIKEVTTCFTYGHSIIEKVPRRRRYANGSKYNDGFVGLKKLAPRSQDSITKWVFSDDGRELAGVEQTIVNNGNYVRYQVSGEPIFIPRDRFMLFRTDTTKDNPEGASPLSSCYIAYRFRKELEEIEAVGYSKNINGVPIVWLHPKYMADDASDSDRAVYSYYKNMVRNLQMNEQTGIVMPLMYDEGRNKMFDFQLLSVDNTTAQHIAAAITRWDNKILTALHSDLLKLGQDAVGSYSLADSKSNMLAMSIEARLKEIQDVLNNDLIPWLYKMNGWRDVEMPKFVYGDLDEIDLEVFSKAIQRAKAVGLVAPTADNINYVAETLGLPDRVDEMMDQEELNILLGKPTSRSGDGLATGMGNGTAKTVASNDNSSLNTENNA
jgi:hypothetical protein